MGSTTSSAANLALSNDIVVPTLPTALNYVNRTATTIWLIWRPSTDNVGVSGYDVFRDGTRVGTTADISFTDTGLMMNTNHTYTVEAFDAAGNRSGVGTSNTLYVGTTGSFSADGDHDGIPDATETALRTNDSAAANFDTSNQIGQNVHRPVP